MIPWGWLSVILSLITLACAGTLATVVAVTDADTLSTVALALAVLAFAAQLIITLADGHHASELNADMKSTLAEMKTSTAAVLTNQNEQSNVMLEALIKVIPQAVENVQDSSSESSDDLRASSEEVRALTQSITDLFTAEFKTSAPSVSTQAAADAKRRSRNRARIIRRMEQLPEEQEGIQLVELLVNMPPKQLSRFARFARDAIQQARKDNQISYRRTVGKTTNLIVQALIEKGLIEVVIEPSAGEGGRVVYAFTDQGWLTAALLRAPMRDLPEWAAPLA